MLSVLEGLMKKLFILIIAAMVVMGCAEKQNPISVASKSDVVATLPKLKSNDQAGAIASAPKAQSETQIGAEGWVKVEGAAKRFDVYIDASTVSDDGKFIKSWVLYDSESEQTEPFTGIRYHSRKDLRIFSCSERTGSYSMEILYKGRMGRGDVVSSRRNEKLKLFPAPPGSGYEALIGAACKLAPKIPASSAILNPQLPVVVTNWLFAGDVQGGRLYMNELTITDVGKYKSVLTLLDYDVVQMSSSQRKYFSSISVHAFYCSENKYEIFESQYFAGRMGIGEAIDIDKEKKITREVVPASGGVEATFKRVCR
jgi:hypothetical protein